VEETTGLRCINLITRSAFDETKIMMIIIVFLVRNAGKHVFRWHSSNVEIGVDSMTASSIPILNWQNNYLLLRVLVTAIVQELIPKWLRLWVVELT